MGVCDLELGGDRLFSSDGRNPRELQPMLALPFHTHCTKMKCAAVEMVYRDSQVLAILLFPFAWDQFSDVLTAVRPQLKKGRAKGRRARRCIASKQGVHSRGYVHVKHS